MKRNLIIYYETEKNKGLEFNGATGMDLFTAMLLLINQMKNDTGWTKEDILSKVNRMLENEEKINNEKRR